MNSEDLQDDDEVIAETLGDLVETVDEIQGSLEVLEAKVDAAPKVIKLKGDDGYTPKKGVDYFDGKTPSQKELVSIIKPLIPKPIPGKPGDDAVVDYPKIIKEVKKEIRTELKPLVYEVVANNHQGGGNANRDIKASGANVLRPFTDINLIPGNNVSFSIVANQQTKYTDWTINATGGSGSGITRMIQSVAVDTTAGSAPTIDYVYLVSSTTTITLPTTIGNSNLYTIKNIGAGVVTIATTGGETIDGDTNLVMPVQFTSVDLVSNNSGNWDIT